MAAGTLPCHMSDTGDRICLACLLVSSSRRCACLQWPPSPTSSSLLPPAAAALDCSRRRACLRCLRCLSEPLLSRLLSTARHVACLSAPLAAAPPCCGCCAEWMGVERGARPAVAARGAHPQPMCSTRAGECKHAATHSTASATHQDKAACTGSTHAGQRSAASARGLHPCSRQQQLHPGYSVGVCLSSDCASADDCASFAWPACVRWRSQVVRACALDDPELIEAEQEDKLHTIEKHATCIQESARKQARSNASERSA